MFSFHKKKGPTLGLDINSDSITLIQLDKTRSGIEVARFACHPTPPNTMREGLIADPETLGAVVMELLGAANIAPSGPAPIVNVVVPAQAVVIRLMPVPTGMPPEELADVVTQEATNHVPFPIEDANLDWSQMPATERTDADGVRRIDVILAAIQRSIIESYWRMADSAGVRLGRVDISSLSVIRSLALAGYLGSTGHLSMIVNIRHDACDINVVRSAMPLFGRSIMLGMDTVTEAVSRSLEIHFDQALDLLPEIVLFGAPATDPRMGQAAQIARTVFSDIADELQRSLEFYKSQVGDVKVDQIILTGPGCMIPQLDQFFSARMNIRTIVADPMRDLSFDNELIVDRMRPILAALIGSSIETGWNPSFTVDLDLNKDGRLPLLYDDRKTQAIAPDERPTPWFKPLLASGCAALLLVAAAWAYITQIDMPNQIKDADAVQQEILNNQKQLTALTKLRQDNNVLSGKKRILDNIIKKSEHWSSYLEAIRKGTPPGVHIDAIVFKPDGVHIQGGARDFTSVSHLAINLLTEPVVKNSSVEWATRNDKEPDIVTFSVLANMQGHDQTAEQPAANGAQTATASPQPLPGSLTDSLKMVKDSAHGVVR
jgi:type IV pilus assembly protein PilM